jgi:hypothetical protein
MPAQEALGRLFNVLPVADDVYVNLAHAGGVTFVGVLAAGDTWTLTEQKADGSGDQALATIERYYTAETVGAAWVKRTQAAASTVVTTSSQDVVVIHVAPEELSADYTQVKLASTSTGTVFAIVHDLKVRRAPENLPAMV